MAATYLRSSADSSWRSSGTSSPSPTPTRPSWPPRAFSAPRPETRLVMRLPSRPWTHRGAALPPRVSAFATLSFIALAVAGLTAGCAVPTTFAAPATTFQYRALQNQFIEAARADNQAAVDPLSASTADAAYASIAAELTPERIAELDPKLRANAWVIRSYSLWRSGRYKDAITSADIGLKTEGLGPRDRVLLELLPALAVDSEAKDLWTAKNRTLTAADYAPFKEAFTQAYFQLSKVETLIDANSAPKPTYYVAYHRWRILND